MGWTITTSRTRLVACVAAACAVATPAAASVTDFRLPPDPSTQQPPPDRIGPVAPDVPESRVRPTPTPTATRPPASVETSPPAVVPPVLTGPAAPQPARTVPTTRPAAQPGAAPPATGESVPAETSDGGLALPPAATSPGAPLPAAPGVASETGGGVSWWLWMLGGLLALGAIGFAAWSWWRRQQAVRPVVVPQLERPRVGAAGQTTAAGAPAAPDTASREPLHVTLEPLRLSLTLINATLSYRLEVANRGVSPIEDLRIGADMISAHASMSREEQLAGPRTAPHQHIERLEPGESRVVEGEFRVPFSQIVPIRQGNAALLLPLARFRLKAAGTSAVVRTFVVGQPGDGAGLQPFRLDLGPRIYPHLAQRAFA